VVALNTKNALKTLWKDTFAVVEWGEVTKPNGATGFGEIPVLTNEPCKLSFSTIKETNQNDKNAAVVQVTKLFCDNLLTIKAGSKITVTRGGNVFEFAQSGLPAIFSNHQEIVLVPFAGWA
jgi:hypothetical protein